MGPGVEGQHRTPVSRITMERQHPIMVQQKGDWSGDPDVRLSDWTGGCVKRDYRMSKRIQTSSRWPSRVEMDTTALPWICPGNAGPRSLLLCLETWQFPRGLQCPWSSPCFPSGPFLAFLWLISEFQGDDSHGLRFPGSQENWLLPGISQWETPMGD